MNLIDQLRELIRACFTGLWIQSHEPHEALQEIAVMCRDRDWTLATWDVASGITIQNGPGDVHASDPLAVIQSAEALANPEGAALLVLHNFHRFLGNAEIVQNVYLQVLKGRQTRTALLVLSPVVDLPVELEKLFTVLHHELPSRSQLEQIARSLTSEDERPSGQILETVLDAAQGLTRLEAENAFALSLIRQQQLDAAAIWELKTQTLKKTGMLTLSRGSSGFETLGGLSALKTFCRRSLLQASVDDPDRRPRGVLLLGVPGVGKSAFCQSLGSETGRPTVILDVGSLLGSLVGQSEANLRQALATIDAMGKVVVMLDEVEKALAGSTGGGRGDSGVSARLFGRLLTWLSDRDSEAYVLCTANDVSCLPPEFGRAERFDGTFFLDLPGDEQKQMIWQQYLRHFALDTVQARPQDRQWTGAEIRSCCRLAALLDMPLLQAAQHIVPVATTASESIEKLRRWASGRCLDADQPGIYTIRSDDQPRRHLSYDPSQN